MSRQIIKQPNGKYAVWTTSSDQFISANCTKEEIINDWISEEIEEIYNRIPQTVNNIVEQLDVGAKPYHQFTMNWEEALETMEEIHGKDKVQTIVDYLEKQ